MFRHAAAHFNSTLPSFVPRASNCVGVGRRCGRSYRIACELLQNIHQANVMIGN